MGVEGNISAVESLSQGVSLLFDRKGLLLPFLLVSMISTVTSLLLVALAQLLGPDWQLFPGAAYVIHTLPVSIVGAVLGAWAIWSVLRAYLRKGIAKGMETSGLNIDRLAGFLSRSNPLLVPVFALVLVQSLISVAVTMGFSFLSLNQLGSWFFWLRWVLDWVIRVLLSLSVFGILVERKGALSAIEQSIRIASGSLSLFGLMFALVLISYALNILFSSLLGGILRLLAGPSAYFTAFYVGNFLVGAVVAALEASCLAHAFFSAKGYVDRVRAAAVRGEVMEGCPGSPRIPNCLECRKLQDYGDKYFCSKFGVAVAKMDESPATKTDRVARRREVS